jgi:hypothetical protein
MLSHAVAGLIKMLQDSHVRTPDFFRAIEKRSDSEAKNLEMRKALIALDIPLSGTAVDALVNQLGPSGHITVVSLKHSFEPHLNTAKSAPGSPSRTKRQVSAVRALIPSAIKWDEEVLGRDGVAGFAKLINDAPVRLKDVWHAVDRKHATRVADDQMVSALLDLEIPMQRHDVVQLVHDIGRSPGGEITYISLKYCLEEHRADSWIKNPKTPAPEETDRQSRDSLEQGGPAAEVVRLQQILDEVAQERDEAEFGLANTQQLRTDDEVNSRQHRRRWRHRTPILNRWRTTLRQRGQPDKQRYGGRVGMRACAYVSGKVVVQRPSIHTER